MAELGLSFEALDLEPGIPYYMVKARPNSTPINQIQFFLESLQDPPPPFLHLHELRHAEGQAMRESDSFLALIPTCI